MTEKHKEYLDKAKRICGIILRPCLAWFLSLFLFFLAHVPYEDFDPVDVVQKVRAWNLIIHLVGFHSIVRAILLYNAYASKKALAEGKATTNFFKNIGYSLADINFWSVTAIPLILFLTSPELPVFEHFRYVIFFNASPESLAYTLYTPGIVTALLFSCALIAAASARKQWLFEQRRVERDQVINQKKKKKLVLTTTDKLAISLSVAVAVCVCVSYISPFILNVISIFALLVSTAWIVGPLLSIFLLVWAIRYYRAYRKRRDFVRDLTRICEEKNIPLTKVKNPYRSLFRDEAGENFSVEYKGERYDCKLIAALRWRDPFIFLPNNSVIQRHNVTIGRGRAKHVLFSWDVQTDFYFSGEGKKIIIALPIPHSIYGVDAGGRSYPLDTGDRVGDYRVFNASAFLGALERDFLDRH